MGGIHITYQSACSVHGYRHAAHAHCELPAPHARPRLLYSGLSVKRSNYGMEKGLAVEDIVFIRLQLPERSFGMSSDSNKLRCTVSIYVTDQ